MPPQREQVSPCSQTQRWGDGLLWDLAREQGLKPSHGWGLCAGVWTSLANGAWTNLAYQILGCVLGL